MQAPRSDPTHPYRSVIAAGGPATVAAGEAMLAAGGNAVDAAVAAAFASFIAEIGLVHWGGAGLALVHDPSSGQSLAYDFLSAMPGLDGPPERSALDFEAVSIDFGSTRQSFHLGRASVAVPGAVFGLCQMARDFGRLELPQLLGPALRLAREGVPLDAFQADTCALLAPLYTHTPGMRRIFLVDGRMIRVGEVLRIPDLAETLERLALGGEAELRVGQLGQALCRDQAARGGMLGPSDLQRYAVRRHAPLRIRYRGLDLLLPPPPSMGGLLTAFSLALLGETGSVAPGSTRELRRFYEVMDLTQEARGRIESMLEVLSGGEVAERVLAPDFVRPHAAQLRARLERGARHGPRDAGAEPPGPAGSRLGNTSHISVLDGDGMAVSLTTTAGESAGYVVPGTGFIPNNMLGEADLNPHGWHAWPAGSRIPSMMTPVLALDGRGVRLVTGSGGSERIRSAVLQVLSAFLEGGLDLAASVNRPRVHLERGILHCEGGSDPLAVDGLEALGYPVRRWPGGSIYFGGAHSVGRGAEGRLAAAGDPRRAGAFGGV
ncbi:MAG: gamma-glutamyltransferase [Caldilineae bacterium]|nr:gamma-glutamyltransferase [Caldilineae bacterium]